MQAPTKSQQVPESQGARRVFVSTATSAEVTQAWHEVEAAVGHLRSALWRDARARTQAALSEVRRHLGDAELELEMWLSHMPGIGPKLAMDMHSRTHPTSEADADSWPTRPTNRLDPEDAALEQGERASFEYVEALGVHTA